MEFAQELIRWFHMSVGFVGLAAFWVPILAPKGGRTHVRFGKIFLWCVYGATLSAILAVTFHLGRLISSGVSLAEHTEDYGLLLFLGYLGIVTFTMVHHAYRVIETRRDLAGLRTPFHNSLAVMSFLASAGIIVFAFTFWSSMSTLFLALSPIGLLVGSGILSYLYRPPAARMAWFYEHMGNMIGAGIAFHTAFAVFGGARLFNLNPSGAWGIVPWILPAGIGIPASIIWGRYYRRRFGDL